MSVRTTELIGRTAELQTLRASIDRAGAGLGSTWIVAGEPGIGKTRLLEELAAACVQGGALVAWGRAWETGGAPAYWPWTQVLRSLLRQADEHVRAELLARHGEALQPLLPGPPTTTARVPLSDAEARFRLFDHAVTALAELAERRPLALLLEDVHAADLASHRLLSFAAAHLRDAPIVIVATSRSSAALLGDTEMGLQRHARVLELPRFTADEIARVLGDVDVAIAREVARVTEGNPLFVLETARYVERLGHLPEARADVALVVPGSVTAVIRQHLTGISEDVRAVLQTASILGRSFDLEPLAALSGRTAEEVRLLLEAAERAGLASETARGAHHFRHQLIQQTLYDDLDDDHRQRLHTRACAWFSANAGRFPWSTASEHAVAGRVATAEGIAACLAAAEDARSRLALDAATDILERALGSFGAQCTAPQRARLQLDRARILTADGRVADGQAAALQAVEIARQVDDAPLFAEAALAYGGAVLFARVDATLVALLREALDRLGPQHEHRPARARVLARLAAALQPAPDPQEPIQMARDAVALARQTQDDETLMHVIGTGVSALMDLADPDERAALNAEHVRLAVAANLPAEELRGRMRLVFDLFDRGETQQACAQLDACEALTQSRLGLPTYQWRVWAARAMVAMWHGQVGDARGFAAHAEELASRTADPNAPRCLVLQNAYFAALRGDWTEFCRLGVVVDDLFGAHPEAARFARALYAGLAARAEPAAAQAITFVDSDDLSLIAAEANVVARDGARIRAHALLERLSGRLNQFVSTGAFGMAWCDHASAVAGRLELALGRPDDAIDSFERALAATAAAGGRLPAAWIALDLARALDERRAPGDGDRARALRLGIRELAEELDLVGLAAAVPVVTDEGDSPSPPTSPAFSFELALDGEVWRIARAGRSFTLKNLKGLQILSRLVDAPGQEFHVLDLDGGLAGDAGVMLDAQARAEYRARVRELRDELQEAESFHDTGRAERARAELEFIAAELSRAVGLHGQSRRAADASQRARVNVQRRLKDAIARLRDHDEDLGRHLEWAVRTGLYCVYHPD